MRERSAYFWFNWHQSVTILTVYEWIFRPQRQISKYQGSKLLKQRIDKRNASVSRKDEIQTNSKNNILWISSTLIGKETSANMMFSFLAVLFQYFSTIIKFLSLSIKLNVSQVCTLKFSCWCHDRKIYYKPTILCVERPHNFGDKLNFMQLKIHWWRFKNFFNTYLSLVPITTLRSHFIVWNPLSCQGESNMQKYPRS